MITHKGVLSGLLRGLLIDTDCEFEMLSHGLGETLAAGLLSPLLSNTL